MFKNLLTAQQVVVVYGFAGVTRANLPRKGKVLIVRSPINPDLSFVVRKTEFSATYGGKLFEVMHSEGVL